MYRILFLFCVHSLFASPIIIGIAGGTGSGKTTLAEKIHHAFPDQSVLISQDFYYKDISHLSMNERSKRNFDHPDAIDIPLLRQNLISLQNGESVEQPIYNFRTHGRETRTIPTSPAPLIVVEGILIFAIPEIREIFDMKIFVDTEDDIRVLRRIERDMKERGRDFDTTKNQYLTTVKPMHDAFVQPSKQYADIIVPEGGHNEIALDLFLSKIRKDLSDLR
jgi:uridine kinase